MAEFTLRRKPAETLKVVIEDKSYEVPLGGSLTPKEMSELDTPEGTRAFFCRHIPPDVTDTLTIDEWNALINAWRMETGKGGRTAGE